MRHREDEEEGISGSSLSNRSSPVADLSLPSQESTRVGLASVVTSWKYTIEERRGRCSEVGQS